jgi:uncharacterized membrane protein YgaE (UPF0421/DUF939 family)
MSGVLTRVNWRQGLKTAIAAGICLALVRVLGFKQGYWACVSTIVVMQSESADTFKASRDRLIGTAFGALAGWGAASVWQGRLVIYAVMVLVLILALEMFDFEKAGRLAGVTATIILLAPSSSPHWIVARDRFLEVSFGIVVALVVSQVLWRQTTVTKTSQG